jgi:hypothetical protein
MTDQTGFETMLELRMRAYAATAVRPVPAHEIARSTMSAAATPVGRISAMRGPRRPALLVGLAALILLGTVAGAALIGGLRPPIQGVFVAGPSLTDGHITNAIALPDGRVLVGVEPVQGTVPGTTTLRCSPPCTPHLMLLDPRTGEFTATTVAPPRLDVEAMALLRDGRVLILSGSADGPGNRSATVYDPVADRFEEVGDPLEARNWPFLVTLPDGRVLIGGGEADDALATSELFDPSTGTFSPAASMTRPRSIGSSATLLRDGRVLVVGGGADVGPSAELYDPATDTFAPTGPMTVARVGFLSATLLGDGRVLLTGGLVPLAADPRTTPDYTPTAEVYDPATGTFSSVGPMAAPRSMHAASILADGTVLVAGGSHARMSEGPPIVVSDAEIFDPATGTFRATGSLHRPRLMPAVVASGDRVLVLGEFNPSEVDPVTGASTEWFQ